MAYDRDSRGNDSQGDYYNRSQSQGYGQSYGQGRGDRPYGGRDQNDDRYSGNSDSDRYGSRDSRYGADASYGNRGGYGDNRGEQYGNRGGYRDGGQNDYHGSYASGGHRFEDVGRNTHADDDNYARNQRNDRNDRDNRGQRDGSYGRQPQGYDYQDRGFVARAGDEVRSWFGDEDAERRREMDSRYDERNAGERNDAHRDSDYHSWRSTQIAALDRDYDEYRNENRTKFHNEFSTWRTSRQGQRDQLGKVEEHMDVVGSDGEHVGTVDKVRGDRILLTKNDKDAGGQHHSIPSSWLQSVDGKVTLAKTAQEAKAQWRDEERNQAMFDYGDNAKGDAAKGNTAQGDATQARQPGQLGNDDAANVRDGQGRTLGRSFSGTY